MVSEAIFPTNLKYVCIEKWSSIFVSGTGSGRTESEQKATLVSENGLFLTLDSGTSSVPYRSESKKMSQIELCN